MITNHNNTTMPLRFGHIIHPTAPWLPKKYIKQKKLPFFGWANPPLSPQQQKNANFYKFFSYFENFRVQGCSLRRGVGACRVSPTFGYKWCTCHCIFYCGLPENFGPENTRKCLVFDPTQPKNKHTVGVSQGLTTKFFAGALQGALGRLGAAWAAPGRLRRCLNPCRTRPARFREN